MRHHRILYTAPVAWLFACVGAERMQMHRQKLTQHEAPISSLWSNLERLLRHLESRLSLHTRP